MAKTSYLQISPEIIDDYNDGLQSADRFIIPRIRVKNLILSRKKVKNLTGRSSLSICKDLWRAMSSAEQSAWKSVDPHPRQHGWRTFVADQCKRIKYGLEGIVTPNQYHQDMVGEILIQDDATEIKLTQPHPQSYWVSHKVTGKKGMYEPVLVTEEFYSPLDLSLNYKSQLFSVGSGAFARLYATVRHLYQGLNLDYDQIIELDLLSDWKSGLLSTPALSGLAIFYNLFIHLYNVQGVLRFDNIKAEHSGSNWARDTYCKNINQAFTRAFYQIPANWGVVTMPEGADYDSIYPTDCLFRKVTQDSDDCFDLGSVYHDDWYLKIGSDGGSLGHIKTGLRFQDVKIPKSAIIDSAVLSVRADSNSNLKLYLKITGDSQDNSPTFSDGDSPTDRSDTTAFVNWDTTNWISGQYYSPPDLKDVIQEIVNRAGWSLGNDLSLFVSWRSPSNEWEYNAISAHNSAQKYGAKLIVNYHT